MKFLLLIMCTAIAALTSSAALGAVTFQDTSLTDDVLRPVTVTGLTVNGVIYDVTIAYSIGINGNNTQNLLGALPDSEAGDGALALQDAINTAAAAAGTDSNETEFYLLSNTQSGMGGAADSLAALVDNTAGAGDFTVNFLSLNGPIFRADRGAATFAIAPVPAIPPVPEPSSTMICATIAVAVILRRRRRRRVN